MSANLAATRRAPAIRALAVDSSAAFFAYLNEHLLDNGKGGMPLFQPLPRNQSVFPDEKAAAFVRGLGIEVGQPGWRRAWLATSEDGILGHVDLRAGILCAIGMILGAWLGGLIAVPMSTPALKAWFGGYLIFSAVLLWMKAKPGKNSQVAASASLKEGGA